MLQSEPAGYSVLGWDWFGISLEDGRDLILNQHRSLARDDPYTSFAVLFDDGVPVRLRNGFTATSDRTWCSPRTGARYPVSWQVQVPDIGLLATLQPIADDQEILVPGSTAIWEGAVDLHGLLAGKKAVGKGRVELVGYGSVLSVRERFRRTVARLLK